MKPEQMMSARANKLGDRPKACFGHNRKPQRWVILAGSVIGGGLLMSGGMMIGGCQTGKAGSKPAPLASELNKDAEKPADVAAVPQPKPEVKEEKPVVRQPEKVAAAAPAGKEGGKEGVKAGGEVMAVLGGKPITFDEIKAPLVEGYGLTVLMGMVQLRQAQEMALQQGIVVSEEDVQEEREATLSRLFADAPAEDHPRLLDQLLSQQRSTRGEWDMLMRTNATLRKIVQPRVAGEVNEAALVEAFGVLYGERVVVRHIQCNNLMEIGEVRRRLTEGQAFDQVARELSRNVRSGPLGGELPAFSRTTTNIPKAFRDAAFELTDGQVSETVEADGAYHVIKLERKIAPQAVTLDEVRETLKANLIDRATQNAIRDVRRQLRQQALAMLEVKDPVLKQQYELKRSRQAEDE